MATYEIRPHAIPSAIEYVNGIKTIVIVETQKSLHEELKTRYSDYPWIDVYSKSDLEPEASLEYDDSISVSVMNDEGIEDLKSELMNIFFE